MENGLKTLVVGYKPTSKKDVFRSGASARNTVSLFQAHGRQPWVKCLNFELIILNV